MFFFFQAEDGIRDDLVTGVQTCALPISPIKTPNPFNTFTPHNILNTRTDGADNLNQSLTIGDTLLMGPNAVQSFRFAYNRAAEIGRASCRERVEIWEGDGLGEHKRVQ